ncbi:MAG: Ni,Fe-hydrogenase large subunit [Persephonella sp.]|nr:MAG: Ni,Fe-hydrogenase large subunit [Persephonella sp.]RUM62267.1 MAG: Ni,Fe-hydrogenase large subunit [Persephonella sp.]
MFKIKKTVLNRVEGEIELKLIWENGRIKDVFIIAPNFRGFEFILKEKSPLDALVINPRICGICGHAHLIATVRTLEALYESSGEKIEIPNKAQLIRDITLSSEIIQNHIRWFYIFVLPDFLKLEKNNKLRKFEPIKGIQWRKGLDASLKILKVIAIFGGQWPHTSYTIPGGVVSDPTNFDITEAIAIVDNLIYFCEKNIIGMSYEKYLSIKDIDEFFDLSKNSDLKTFLLLCQKHNLDKIGKSYHRFLTVCDMSPLISKGITKKKRKNFDINKVKEVSSYSYLTNEGILTEEKRYSWAKAVRYEGLPYETSPLSRRINNQDLLFLNLLKKYKDSYMVRTWARIDEIIKILISVKERLKEINVKEKSYIKPKKDIKQIEGKAFGFCEAARGSLIHSIEVSKGKIKNYNIITPSTWNLGPRCEKYLSPAEKAIKGLKSQLLAEMVLRSFDVCSVCTTH